MLNAAAWLEELGLAQYAEVFAEQAIDFEIVPALTEADLEKLGMPLSHRRRMLQAIGALAGTTAAKTDQAHIALPRSSAQRRQATMLVCDLVGSTALASAAGLLTSHACAAPSGQAEFIYRRMNPIICRTGEGDGRWSTWDGRWRQLGHCQPCERGRPRCASH
jgi:SAM domain (Sterile alpha motif)